MLLLKNGGADSFFFFFFIYCKGERICTPKSKPVETAVRIAAGSI